MCGGQAEVLRSLILRVALILFSAGSFAIYGAACFFSDHLKQEFVRYRFERERTLVGVLQMGAALGLLLGLEVPWIGRAAAAGLALMMLLAVGVRIRIKDSVLQTSPALLYLFLNGWLCWAAF